MAFYKDSAGNAQNIEVSPNDYKAAEDANQSLPQYLNTKFKDADPKYGTAFQQLCASEGLVSASKNSFGLRAPTIDKILAGTSGFNAAVTNTSDKSTPFGSASRVLFPAAIIQMVEDTVRINLESDPAAFRNMVAIEQGIDNDIFLQPTLSYKDNGGRDSTTALAQRITEFSDTPMMMLLGSSDKPRSLPTHGFGIEISEKIKRTATMDLLSMTLSRKLAVEKNARVYGYLNQLFAGDADANLGAIPSLTTVGLDATCPAGTVTHKAWVKF